MRALITTIGVGCSIVLVSAMSAMPGPRQGTRQQTIASPVSDARSDADQAGAALLRALEANSRGGNARDHRAAVSQLSNSFKALAVHYRRVLSFALTCARFGVAKVPRDLAYDPRAAMPDVPLPLALVFVPDPQPAEWTVSAFPAGDVADGPLGRRLTESDRSSLKNGINNAYFNMRDQPGTAEKNGQVEVSLGQDRAGFSDPASLTETVIISTTHLIYRATVKPEASPGAWTTPTRVAVFRGFDSWPPRGQTLLSGSDQITLADDAVLSPRSIALIRRVDTQVGKYTTQGMVGVANAYRTDYQIAILSYPEGALLAAKLISGDPPQLSRGGVDQWGVEAAEVGLHTWLHKSDTTHEAQRVRAAMRGSALPGGDTSVVVFWQPPYYGPSSDDVRASYQEDARAGDVALLLDSGATAAKPGPGNGPGIVFGKHYMCFVVPRGSTPVAFVFGGKRYTITQASVDESDEMLGWVYDKR